jgi:ABC-2 type transport system permease protein
MTSKLLVVARQEILYHLSQWTFYITILIMPLVFAAVGAIPRLRDAAEQAPLPQVETILNVAPAELDAPVGLVDGAGIIATLPELKNGNGFRLFTNETEAAAALASGQVESFYVIAEDYLRSGRVVQFSNRPQLLADSDAALRALLRKNHLAALNDPNLASRLENPVTLVRQGPPPPVIRFIPTDLDMNKLISAGLVVGLFVYAINVGGNLLLRALQREVWAKVLEVLVVSASPAQFIGGKLLGLITLTLAQVGLTLLAGALVYGQNPDGSGPAALPWTALILSLPYLVLGFLAYCGGIMGIAAMWPDFRESGLLLAAMRLLTLTPLAGVLFILPNTNGVLAVAFTLFPLTSHLLMPFRLLLTEVPVWQWGLGVLVLLAWAVFWVWLSTRLFRAHGLLTGRAADPKLIWRALF